MFGRSNWSGGGWVLSLGTLLVFLAVDGVSTSTCVKESASGGVTINGGCKNVNVKLEIAVGDFEFDMELGSSSETIISKTTLKIGKCTIEGDVHTRGSKGPDWSIDGVLPFMFPIKGKLSGTGVTLQHDTNNHVFSCQPGFEKSKSGSLVVPIGLQSQDPLPNLNLVLRKTKIYDADADGAGGWKLWTIIGGTVVPIVILVILILVSVFVCVPWCKRWRLKDEIGAYDRMAGKRRKSNEKSGHSSAIGPLKTAEEADEFTYAQWSWPTTMYCREPVFRLTEIIGTPTEEKAVAFLKRFPFQNELQKKALEMSFAAWTEDNRKNKHGEYVDEAIETMRLLLLKSLPTAKAKIKK